MIINGSLLLEAAPIKDMVMNKIQAIPTSWGLSECGYDIRIAEDILFDPEFKLDDHAYPNIIVNGGYEEGGYEKKGRFVLGSSVEEFQMPNHLMGRILNKSTWARLGVDASMTTNTEPGWNGHLTIELHFRGEEEVHIPAGSGICQIIFETLAEPAEYKGKYQNQKEGAQPALLTPCQVGMTCSDEDFPKHLGGMQRYRFPHDERGWTPK